MNDVNVPEGYTSTDVGVIPEDWEVIVISEASSKIQDGTHFSPKTKTGSYLYVTSKNIKQGYLDLKDCGFITKEEHDKIYARCDVKYGDVLLTKDGVNTGNAAINNLHDEFSLLSSVAFIRPNQKKLNSRFLLDYFLSSSGHKRLTDMMSGLAITRLTLNKIKSFKIPLPPLPEQKAIASVLSDVDELIRECDSLLAKKRDIKQGTMQQLLTGKKRLPGFSGEWEEKKLRDICWFQEGPGLRQWQFTKEGMKVINVTNLENGYLNLDRTDRHISIEEFKKTYQHFEIDSRDIVVASSGNSYGKTSVVRTQDLPLMMNTSVIRFKPLKELAYKFLLSFLRSNIFKNQINLLITGGAQPNFGPVHLDKIVILIPPTLPEQKEIAQILSDMDAEIEALEQKRDKYKAIKQGMMQELLTGKIRIIGFKDEQD